MNKRIDVKVVVFLVTYVVMVFLIVIYVVFVISIINLLCNHWSMILSSSFRSKIVKIIDQHIKCKVCRHCYHSTVLVSLVFCLVAQFHLEMIKILKWNSIDNYSSIILLLITFSSEICTKE